MVCSCILTLSKVLIHIYSSLGNSWGSSKVLLLSKPSITSCSSSRSHKDVLLGSVGLSPNNGGSCRVLIWDLGGVHPLVIMMMISPRIGVLIEIHQDVLNLSLLGRVHDHDYGRRWLSISCLWVDVLIASESIWYATLTVVGIKCLGMWACPLLLSSSCMLMIRREASCSSGWGLSLWYPLLLLLIWGMLLLLLVLLRSRGEVIMCCILQMLLIALMMIAVSMAACLRRMLNVLFDELLAQSVEVNILLGCYLQIDLLVPSDMMRSLMLSL